MEDREFDEIMNKYVASTGRDAEFDLAKLRQKENAGNKAGAAFCVGFGCRGAHSRGGFGSCVAADARRWR